MRDKLFFKRDEEGNIGLRQKWVLGVGAALIFLAALASWALLQESPPSPRQGEQDRIVKEIPKDAVLTPKENTQTSEEPESVSVKEEATEPPASALSQEESAGDSVPEESAGSVEEAGEGESTKSPASGETEIERTAEPDAGAEIPKIPAGGSNGEQLQVVRVESPAPFDNEQHRREALPPGPESGAEAPGTQEGGPAAPEAPDEESEPAEPREPEPEPELAQEPSGPRYVVRLGSFRVKENAENLLKKMQDKGYHVEKGTFDHQKLGRLHTVQLEPVPTIEKARELVDEMKRKEQIDAFIIRESSP